VTFLVDTDVLSEAIKRKVDEAVVRWLRSHRAELVINPIILGEVRMGILLLPRSKRRERLLDWYTTTVEKIAVITFDSYSGLVWAELSADLWKKGRVMPIKDSLIAATARQHGLTIATRNTEDYKHAGVKLVNPFGSS
jgi:predicted nucleic acid-binding protein